jgi:hypothetical protein
MGMNAHINVGGDLLLLTVDGIIPLSQAITKEVGQLELAMLTRTIKPMWRDSVTEKRANPWTAKKWDEYGGIFIALPGGKPGERVCLVANNRGRVGQVHDYVPLAGSGRGAIRSSAPGRHHHAGQAPLPMTACPFCTVGGWGNVWRAVRDIVWHQARATFAESGEPFVPHRGHGR